MVDKARYDLQHQSEATADASVAKQAQLEAKLKENINDEKLAWHSALGKLKEGSALREEVEATVANWESVDRLKTDRQGRGYTPEERRAQLGEALRQRAEHYAAHPQFAKKADLEDLKRISENLAEGAAPYFLYHYRRSAAGLVPGERRRQYPYTLQEAKNISQNKKYRDALLRRLESELSKDF